MIQRSLQFLLLLPLTRAFSTAGSSRQSRIPFLGDQFERPTRRTLLHSASEQEESNEHHHEPSLRSERNVTQVVEQKIRRQRAQAEIDRILKGPDPPFDLPTEMKRVASIAPPVGGDENFDADELEVDLYQAVKQQDYSSASRLQQEISQMHLDDCSAVLQVNSAFYRAFSDKDLREMESLWLKDATATCIHPSCKPLIGAKAVLKSWARMFEVTNGSFQRSWMEPDQIRVSVKGASTAVVTCDELVYARRFVRGQRRQTELVNKLTATNIFRKVGGRWYMTYHHASWHADSEVAKMALKRSSAVSSRRLSSRRPTDAAPDMTQAGMDGILGTSNFGPLLGPTNGEKKPVKRIVMGNLSDILDGKLGDLLGSGDGEESDDQQNGAIIRFSRIEQDEDDDDDDEDDGMEVVSVEDEDDEEDDDDADADEDDDGDDSDASALTSIKRWAETSAEKAAKKSNVVSGVPKDALRQSCISALRKLCEQGSISPKQKRVLLTDIITCSARGEFSMVEVAYELLCGEGEDKDAAEEEFADQCRVFAHSLPESPTR